MLKRIRGRKSFSLPDIRGNPGELNLTKNRARLEIVKEERQKYDLKSAEYQMHQGRDSRKGVGLFVGMNRGSGVVGMRNNSNEEHFSKSSPGRKLRFTMGDDEVMGQAGTSYYRRSIQRETRGGSGSGSGEGDRKDGSSDQQQRGSPRGYSVTYGHKPQLNLTRSTKPSGRRQIFDVWSD